MVKPEERFVFKRHVEDCEESNQELLDIIDMFPPVSGDNVTKLNFYENRRKEKVNLYENLLFNKLFVYIKDVVENDLYYKNFTEEDFKWIGPSWFHQYEKDSEYRWHTHNGMYVLLYFVELEDESLTTQLFDPISKSLFDLKCKSGDLLLFPSFMHHYAPKNVIGKTRKTIIAGNFDITAESDKERILNEIN